MSAGLVSAKVDIQNPEVTGAHVSNKARSSVEVKDSCNCCKLCFPCFGRKSARKKDPDPRVAMIRDSTIIMPSPMPTQDTDTPKFSVVKKSPAFDDMSQFTTMPVINHQEITVNMNCDQTAPTLTIYSPVSSTSNASLDELSSQSSMSKH